MHCKKGTVGRFLPKVRYQLKPVEGLPEGGRLWIKGPNVMQGYILHGKPNHIVPPKNNWHDTGDIVSIDVDGYVSILDRAKRFSKIAGEMISLSAVEKVLASAVPNFSHAVISSPCHKKGEQLTLFTEDKTLTKSVLLKAFRQAKVPDLWAPKNIRYRELPRLPTGKVDYKQLQLDIDQDTR